MVQPLLDCYGPMLVSVVQPYPDPEYLRQEACKPWMPEAPGPPATSSSAPPELHTSPQLHTSHSNEERF